MKNPFLNKIWLILLIIFPVLLWILPADYFDHNTVKLCLSIIFFDRECVGCGLTRAVMHFHHFEITEAIYFNPLVIIVYPLLVFLWFTWVNASLKRGYGVKIPGFSNKKVG